MALREVTGKYLHFKDGSPQVSKTITIELTANDFDAEATYPKETINAYTNADGEVFANVEGTLPLMLWCNDDGISESNYKVTDPDAFQWEFDLSLGDESPISMQELRVFGTNITPDDPLNEIIDGVINNKAVFHSAPQVLAPTNRATALANLLGATVLAGAIFFGSSIGALAQDPTKINYDVDTETLYTENLEVGGLISGGAMTGYQLISAKGQANGYVGLGSDSKIDASFLPNISLNTIQVVADQSARLALTNVQVGDAVKQTDTLETYLLSATDPTNNSNWILIADVSPDWSVVTNKPTTDGITEGSTNFYYTASRFNTSFGGKSTSDLAEGTNLYYTASRFNTAFSGKTTTDLAEGSNLYFTNARVLSATLTGFSAGTNTALSSANSVLVGFQNLQGQVSARLVASNNLSDLTVAGDARSNLGLGALAVKSTIATADIDANAVTLAKFQQIATGSLVGRSTASTGNVEVITVGTNLTISSGSISLSTSPVFSGTPTAPTASVGTNDLQVATTAFVRAEISSMLASNDAMIFKGAIDCSASPNYPSANAGDTYKVSVAGKIGGASGTTVEVNDTLICSVDSSASGNQATVGANWFILQSNIDGAVTGQSSSVDDELVLWSGSSGKVIKRSTGNGFVFATNGGASFVSTTGSGNVVLTGTPTLTTPVLGVATATSINKVAITAPATSATLTIGNGKTFTVSNTLTFTGNDSSSVVFGAGGDVAYLGTAQSFTATQTITPAVNTSALVISGASLTGSNAQSLVSLAQTWNTSGTPTAFLLNITDTASNVNSLAIDIQKSGVSSFKIDKWGNTTSASLRTSGITNSDVNAYSWLSRGSISASADGSILLRNNATTGFSYIQFGGTTNSFNAIGRDAVNGFTFQSAAGTATWNDASTANSGTVANRYLVGIAAPTLTSTGTSVTNTVASTVYIGGAPTDSTNTTSTTKYALNVAGGNVLFGGNLAVTGTTTLGGNAIVLGGAFTTSGAFTTTLTVTANTSLTLPTSGTLATINATVNAQTGTSYTLTSADNGCVITLSNASAITLTVPSGLGAGFNCIVIQLGAGQATFTASSTTINQADSYTKTAKQYAMTTLVAYTSNVFALGGQLA